LCISHAEQKADAAFSKWVRKRDGGCTAWSLFPVACAGGLNAAHIVGRRNHATRFDPADVHALCDAHHRLVDQHGSEHAKFIWATSILGTEGYEALMWRAYPVASRRDSVEAALARYRDGAK
jgi:hypothetical protein